MQSQDSHKALLTRPVVRERREKREEKKEDRLRDGVGEGGEGGK